MSSDRQPLLNHLTISHVARRSTKCVLAAGCVAIAALLAITTWLGINAVEDANGASQLAARAALCGIPTLAMSPQPPLGFHAELRGKVSAALDRRLGRNHTNPALLYLVGATTESHFYADTELPLWQESNFFYLSGYGDSGGELVCLLSSREAPTTNRTLNCTLVAIQPDLSYAIWNGVPPSLESLQDMLQVDSVVWSSDLPAVVSTMIDAATVDGVLPTVFTLPGVNLPPSLAGLSVNGSVLRDAIGDARALKTSAEIAFMTAAANVGTVAHTRVMAEALRSTHEFQVEAKFVDIHTLCGITQQAYLPIVGSGARSAILHYSANSLPLDSNWVLIDAGGTYYGYTTDITRTWPVNGEFSEAQAVIYDIVLSTQDAGLQKMTAGMPWLNVSLAARDALLLGLLRAGLVNGTLKELRANGISSVFMPHSLGHHLGLDVHDYVPSGLQPCVPSEDPEDDTPCPGILQNNMVITCEPGLYLIPALLNASLANPLKAPFLNASKIRELVAANVGGVRIEDVVVIQGDSPVILSAGVPRTRADISKLSRKN